MKVQFTLGRPVLPVSTSSKVEVLVSFSAEAPAEQRRGLNLSVVIDRSGSMAGTPLKQAVAAAKKLVGRLGPEDWLSVVTYDDRADTVVAPQQVKDRAAIEAALGKVRAGGCTNLSGGWLKGVGHVQANQTPERVNRVLLLTDGQANMGVTDPKKLVATALEKAAAGVTTTTLGFGRNFNEDLLIGMANAGEGHFYFIQTPQDAAEVFGIEMEGLSSLVGQNLVVTLKPAPEVKVSSVLNRYRFEARGQEVEVGLGDVYATEPRELALELSVEAGGAQGPMKVATLEYRYQAVEDGAIRERTGELPLMVTLGTAAEAGAAPVDGKVVEQTRKLRIARAKDEAVALADKGKHADAATLLRDMLAELSLGVDKASYDIAEEMEQLAHFATQLEKKKYDAELRKELRDQSYQAGTRVRGDLRLRGTAGGSADTLAAVSDAGSGVVLECAKDGGRLRVRPVSEGYDGGMYVQFPRSLREEGVRYVVEKLVQAAGGFYRVEGNIQRLVRPGEERAARAASTSRARSGKPTASKVTGTAADLPATTAVGNGVLVQCVKEGSKLRARVVSDGYDPDFNMRFPRSIREEGTLYVVEDVIPGPGGTSYIACGDIKRLEQ